MSQRVRPAALPLPVRQDVHALTMPAVIDRWTESSAGLRSAAVGDNVITMFEAIGEDFWSGGGITARKVTSQLRAIGERPVEVQINSFGGDMFEGIAIYNVLREHAQTVTVKVMGMAASAASIIAMAGDRIEIGAAGFLMIHNCWVVAAGNRHDMRETSEWLEPFDQGMRDLYAARSGQDPELVARWMDAETYMSGSLAIERGFADAILPADAVVEDPGAVAGDRAASALRAVELRLIASGASPTEARERIQQIQGLQSRAPETVVAADAEDWSGVTDLIATLRS